MNTQYVKSVRVIVLATLATLLLSAAPGCKGRPERSVAIGAACEEDRDCVAFSDCVAMENDKKVCTKSCSPQLKDCPAPLTCEKVSLTQTVGTKNLATVDVFRCIRH